MGNKKIMLTESIGLAIFSEIASAENKCNVTKAENFIIQRKERKKKQKPKQHR